MLLDPAQTAVLLRQAAEQRFALLAVNADSPAAITDVLDAALAESAPIIVETSLWQLTGRSFGAGDAALGLARYLVQIALLANSPRYAHLPVLLHTDHIRGPLTLQLLSDAIRGLPTGVAGGRLSPSSISLDSSDLTESENIAHCRHLCDVARDSGHDLTLEMEAGVDDGITSEATARHLLGAVESFAPGCLQLWAPGVGTRHGLGEQATFSLEAVRAHRRWAEDLLGRPVGLALHGSSGLSADALAAAVDAGVVKVNWSSESLKIRAAAAQAYALEKSAELQPGHPHWKATAMDDGWQSALSDVYVPAVRERIRCLGGTGRAERVHR